MATPSPGLEEVLSPKIRAWVWVISNVGFPMVVAGYLLLRVTSTLDQINQTLIAQQEVLRTIQSMVDVLSRH